MRPTQRSLPALLAAGLALSVTGCGHRIGDSCNTNVDCSPLGDRFCDVASPSGYCTIEGCDVRFDSSGNQVDTCQSAASESVCVRFFVLSETKCDPANPQATCGADELCLCDFSDASTEPAHCVPAPMSSGPALAHCARTSTERRWCMLKCNNTGDCRSGYQCISPGTLGAEPVPRGLITTDAGTLAPTGDFSQKFCVFQGS